jgi:aryl-alcohol dehydrogenase-like predicted oxidoreductase
MFPIPGTRRVKYIEENVGAIQVKFTDSELQKIDKILKSLPPIGDRYADMSSIDI